MNRNLVIVMAGDGSLHEKYAASGGGYDLWIVYYGDDLEIFKRFKTSADWATRAKGLKIDLIRTVLIEGMHLQGQNSLASYDYVFFPDDDIDFPAGAEDLTRLFDLARALKADVFQPAVTNAFFSPGWESTRQVPGAVCHRTNIVELMMNGFSGEALTKAYFPAIHALEFSKSGWGVEPITQKIGEAVLGRALRTFVMDSIGVVHTRPLGSNGRVHLMGRAEAQYVPQIHSNRMRTLQVYGTLEAAVGDMEREAESGFVSRRDPEAIDRYMRRATWLAEAQQFKERTFRRLRRRP